MLAETFSIYSALHTQIFLDCLYMYVVIGPSISTKKQSFVSVAVFPPLPIQSSSLTLLLHDIYAIMLGGFRGHAPWINKKDICKF